jgi:hypothetical protein
MCVCICQATRHQTPHNTLLSLATTNTTVSTCGEQAGALAGLQTIPPFAHSAPPPAPHHTITTTASPGSLRALLQMAAASTVFLGRGLATRAAASSRCVCVRLPGVLVACVCWVAATPARLLTPCQPWLPPHSPALRACVRAGQRSSMPSWSASARTALPACTTSQSGAPRSGWQEASSARTATAQTCTVCMRGVPPTNQPTNRRRTALTLAGTGAGRGTLWHQPHPRLPPRSHAHHSHGLHGGARGVWGADHERWTIGPL